MTEDEGSSITDPASFPFWVGQGSGHVTVEAPTVHRVPGPSVRVPTLGPARRGTHGSG